MHRLFPVAFAAVLLVAPFVARADEIDQKLKGCARNLSMLGVALEMWALDHDGTYPAKLDVLYPEYLKKPMLCPAAERDTYAAGYRVAPDETWVVECKGHNHGAAGADRPSYQFLNGIVLREGDVWKPWVDGDPIYARFSPGSARKTK